MNTTPTGKILRNFELARDIANDADQVPSGCSKHGAIVVRNGKILGTGFNNKRTYVKGCVVSSEHGEVSALRKSSNTRNPSPNRRSGCSKRTLEQRHCLKWG